ncbi:hypothetical protein GCM10028833_29780 [Glycomyces tarimensis]
MKTRTVRKAALVGGIATGALLFSGSAAQAADTEVEEAGLDTIKAAPELLGGLPVPTDSVPGLNAVVPPQTAVPVLDSKVDDTVKKTDDKTDKDAPADAGGSPVGDLLGDLGGGLPVPLPF